MKISEVMTKAKDKTRKFAKDVIGKIAQASPSKEGKASGKHTIAIIHFNTPELTEAAILSVRKQCAYNYDIVVFDNSTERPFTLKMEGVRVIDNTKGKYVNFDKELAKYPDKQIEYNRIANWASVKHMLSVQKLWELIPGGFILLESDVLLKRDIGFLWDEKFAACGKVQFFRGKRIERDRLIPFLCYLNVPLLVDNGARYFDPKRSWGLMKDDTNPCNWYDTGACVLEDIINTKPALVCRNYDNLDRCYLHFANASWRRNDKESHIKWLNQNQNLWK